MRVITFVHLLRKQIIIIPHDNAKAVITSTVMRMHMCMYVPMCVCACVPIDEQEMILLYTAMVRARKVYTGVQGLDLATELSAFIEQSQNREPSFVPKTIHQK